MNMHTIDDNSISEKEIWKFIIDSSIITSNIEGNAYFEVFNTKLGHNLDALNDVISSSYFHVIWFNNNKSKNDLDSYYDKIIEVLKDNKVKLDLMDGD